jgi:hypothetical protein
MSTKCVPTTFPKLANMDTTLHLHILLKELSCRKIGGLTSDKP